MNCKNCQTPLNKNNQYCYDCGAKVVSERISTKLLLREFFANYIGWDNSFIVTFLGLLKAPHNVITTYLSGVRKRYMPPFLFVGLGVAFATITYNFFSVEYLEMANAAGKLQLESIQESFDQGELSQEQFDMQLKSVELSEKLQAGLLKYFNIISFLFLPLYALVSFIVFGKKLHYGEHLVINSYLQGVSFFVGIPIFIISVYVYPPLYVIQIFGIFAYYLWTYAKLLQLSFGKILLKLLLFIGVIIGMSIIITIIGILVVVIMMLQTKA